MNDLLCTILDPHQMHEHQSYEMFQASIKAMRVVISYSQPSLCLLDINWVARKPIYMFDEHGLIKRSNVENKTLFF